jgi:hypothetical protein
MRFKLNPLIPFNILKFLQASQSSSYILTEDGQNNGKQESHHCLYFLLNIVVSNYCGYYVVPHKCHKEDDNNKANLPCIYLGGFYCWLMITSGELEFLVIVVTILEKRKEMEEKKKKEIKGACDRNKCPPPLMVLNIFLSHSKYSKAPMKFNFSHMTFDK